MRRFLTPAVILSGLLAIHVALPAGPALALPAQDPAGAPAAGERVCEITDERLRELSGLVATANGYIVVNDGTEVDRNERIFYLDSSCEVDDTVAYPSRPLDPEDLALSPDGQTLWIADIGDNPTNDERRERVALWSMPVDGSAQPEIHRVSYPDGPHDAEALLIGADGVPLIITKATGPAGIYRPVGQLRSNNDDPVPMEKVGELELPRTTTPNLFAAAGRLTVTGAARSPDGTRVVIRTYADAFEWDVPAGGDLVAILTSEEPRATALADAFGESIAYTPDGTSFLTVSDVATLDEDTPVEILRYTPSTEVAAAVGDDGDDGQEGPSWLNRITLQDINYLIAAVGVLGALLVGVGIYGIVRARRRVRRNGNRETTRADRDGDGDDDSAYASDNLVSGAYTSDRLVSGAYASGALGSGAVPTGAAGVPKSGAVYGAAKPVAAAGRPPAAGGPPPAAGAGPRGGGVYGGQKPSGGVYGGGGGGAGGPRRESGGYRAAGVVDSGAVYGSATPAPPNPPARPGAGVYGGGRSAGGGDVGGDYPGEGYPADRYDQPRAGGRPPERGRGGGRDAGVYGRAASDHPDD